MIEFNPKYWFFPRPPPSPLEVATSRYVETQHALLVAQEDKERAISSVEMFEVRLERLRETMRELAGEKLPATTTVT